MYRFEELSTRDQIVLTRDEVFRITRQIFMEPVYLKDYVSAKSLSVEQAKGIFAAISKMNSSKCICCRVFNYEHNGPLTTELEPLIEIAQRTVRARRY